MVTREFKIELPEEVQIILSKLQEHGKGFLVGGAVRDSLLGIKPKDYDFCTDISYDKLLDIFKDYNPKEIGAHFGIIQIKVNGEHFEIAKFRKDIGLSDNRREQEVEFTSSLEEDLKRRDFTINALAYDSTHIHSLLKTHLKHIDDNVLCFVGECKQRLEEDPLRVFRLVRFLSQKPMLYFAELQAVKNWARANGDKVSALSKERIRDEFNKILVSKAPRKGLDLLIHLGLMKYVCEEVGELEIEQYNPHHNKSVLNHVLTAVESCEPILELRLSALFHDVAKPRCFTLDENEIGHFYGHEKLGEDMTRELLSNLKYDNKLIDTVCKLVGNHMNTQDMQKPKSMRKLINKVGVENIPTLFKLMEADIVSSCPPFNFEGLDKMKILFYEIMKENKENPSLKLSDVAVKGDDLIKLGYVQGKILGDKLKALHEIILEQGSAYNNKEYLLKFC